MRPPLLPLGLRRVAILLSSIFVVALAIPTRLKPWIAAPNPQWTPVDRQTPPGEATRSQDAEAIRKLGTIPPKPIVVSDPKRNSAAEQEMRRTRLEEAKHDAATLAELAEFLKSDLTNSNQNTLSVDTMKRAEKIERLAKKIKNSTKFL